MDVGYVLVCLCIPVCECVSAHVCVCLHAWTCAGASQNELPAYCRCSSLYQRLKEAMENEALEPEVKCSYPSSVQKNRASEEKAKCLGPHPRLTVFFTPPEAESGDVWLLSLWPLRHQLWILRSKLKLWKIVRLNPRTLISEMNPWRSFSRYLMI